MDLSGSTLTPIQRDLLRAVFAERAGFFLTGGSALAEYYLHHRRSEDLDLFTTDDVAFATGASLIEAAARRLGATVQWVRTGPQFRRGLVIRGTESVVVDLVRDIDQQIVEGKPVKDGVRVDSIEDITANKLCALLGRQEVKDVIDLYFLERSGVDLAASVALAARKDAGMNPAVLSQICASIPIPAIPATLVQAVSRETLQEFLADLSRRLARLAFPG